MQAPWVTKQVTFEGTEKMLTYGLGQLVVIECDLMDEKNVARAVKGSDAVIYCASSFEGGRLKVCCACVCVCVFCFCFCLCCGFVVHDPL
jgi:hypothetical protein